MFEIFTKRPLTIAPNFSARYSKSMMERAIEHHITTSRLLTRSPKMFTALKLIVERIERETHDAGFLVAPDQRFPHVQCVFQIYALAKSVLNEIDGKQAPEAPTQSA